MTPKKLNLKKDALEPELSNLNKEKNQRILKLEV